MGPGTINAEAVYDDGTLLCAPIEEVISGVYDRAEWAELASDRGLDAYEAMKARGFSPGSADAYVAELEAAQGVPGYWDRQGWKARLAERRDVVVEIEGAPIEEGRRQVVEQRPVGISNAERHERTLLALDYAALAIRDLTKRVQELESRLVRLPHV